MLNILVFIQRIIASNVSCNNLSEKQFFVGLLLSRDFLFSVKHVSMYENQIKERLARLVSDYIVPLL